MKVLEVSLSLLLLVAAAMVFTLMPGGYLIMLIAGSLLSLLYFYFGLIIFNEKRLKDFFKASTYKDLGWARTALGTLTGIAIATLVLGILFRVNFYPGAQLMLKIGWASLALVFLIVVTATLLNKKGFKIIITRAAFWGTLGLMLYLWPMQKQLEFQYRNHPEYVEAAIESINNPDNIELREKMVEERRRIK